jgi:hypothetical protein
VNEESSALSKCAIGLFNSERNIADDANVGQLTLYGLFGL